MKTHHRLVTLAIVIVALAPATATAVTPGSNGRIAYSIQASPNDPGYEARGLYTVNPDGSDPKLIDSEGYSPAWAPDGSRLAYVRLAGAPKSCEFDLYVGDANGGNAAKVFDFPGGFNCAGPPSISWSTAGIVFGSTGKQPAMTTEPAVAGEPGLVLPDGSGARPFFSAAAHEQGWREAALVEWSPSGDRVVFSSSGTNDPTSGFPNNGPSEIYVADAAGNVLAALTAPANSGFGDVAPSWSPDGQRILFLRSTPTPQLFEMGADGSGQALVNPQLRLSVWSPDGTHVVSVSGQTGPLVAGPLNGKTGCVASWPGGSVAGIAWQPRSSSPAPPPVSGRECEGGNGALTLTLKAKKQQEADGPIVVRATATARCDITLTGTVKPAGGPKGNLKFVTDELRPGKPTKAKLKPEPDVASDLRDAGKGKAKVIGICVSADGARSKDVAKVSLK